MFVIIKNGGKQYKVQSGDIIKLDYQGSDKGNKIVFKEVIACNVDNQNLIGKPYLTNVEVIGEILENKKDKKILIFKKRRRHNSRRLNGHRQTLSVVKINNIKLDGKVIGKDDVKVNDQKKVKATNANKAKASQTPNNTKGNINKTANKNTPKIKKE